MSRAGKESNLGAWKTPTDKVPALNGANSLFKPVEGCKFHSIEFIYTYSPFPVLTSQIS